jgi:putative membrane protein
MEDFLLDWYPWIKAVHIIAVISWMAGMLYLPRLFVYHVDAEIGSVQSETFKVMERRLLRAIINPAMMVAWICGIAMFFTPGIIDFAGDHWFHVKLLAAILLSSIHGWFSRWRKAFERDENIHSAKFFRYWNEVPTLAMIIIVVMAIVRPF